VQFIDWQEDLEDVLRRIPQQLCSHMERVGYKPDMGQ
jgi:hypothetical protein